MSKVCIFTIVSKNYLHFARTLMSSVQEHYSDAKRVVILCDTEGSYDSSGEIFDVINVQDLGIDDFAEFVFRYNILELNTAAKPFAFEKLLSEGYENVIYFDPDIRVFSSLDGMCSVISKNNIVLTPHLTEELDDGFRPDETDILRAGTYNLGYIGINNQAESKKLINWWKKRLRTLCINDVSRGLFVDQKWMDLAPALFKGVYIQHDLGWNVAYWNLAHRPIFQSDQNEYLVNGSPLVFFHYSGFKYKDKILSIHQNRFDFENCGKVTQGLFDLYARELEDNDSDKISLSEYGFAKYKDGSSIADILRECYLSMQESLTEPLSVSLEAPSQDLLDIMNQPAVDQSGRENKYITYLAHKIYLSRQDLNVVFPDIFGQHARAFAGWFLASAEREYGLSELFTKPIFEIVSQEQVDTPSEPKHFRKEAFLLMHSRPKLMKFLGKLPGQKYRTQIKQRWLGKKFGQAASSTGGSTESQTQSHCEANNISDRGLNVIGYLYAESGTGEAARSTIRAAKAVGLDVAGIDIRKNNVSRMNENPDVEIESQPKHGINIFHINADQTNAVLNEMDPSLLSSCYNIGFWFWELEEMPEEYLPAYEHLDEIWVASKFCQDAVSKQANVPVSLIPLCIEQTPSSRNKSREDLKLPDDDFLILSCIDMLSVPERKNPIGVLRAFEQLCKSQMKVSLVLKLSNLDRCTDQVKEEIVSLVDRLPVILIDQYLERSELNELMANSDCYFSMHRSEGFGLPLAEAMSLGIPVVATGWSSNTDFMTVNNSFLVEYELVNLDKDYGPYKKGQIWAEPNIDHAASCLKQVIDNPKLRNDKSARAKSDIAQLNSASHIGERIKARINAITQR